MGGTLYLSSAAQAFVMNLLPFLSMTASMCTAVVACGIAMALLALVVHMAMNHTVELNAAIDLNVP